MPIKKKIKKIKWEDVISDQTKPTSNTSQQALSSKVKLLVIIFFALEL